jgi:hypothetical protein
MAKKTTTAKTASTKAKAVLNTRNPKKPMAISGNTMNSESMYRKGGSTKKYQTGGAMDKVGSVGKKAMGSSAVTPYVAKAASAYLTGIQKVGDAIKKATPSAKKAMDTLSKNPKPIGGYKKGGSTKSKCK